MPLVIGSLGGRHTHTHTHRHIDTQTHRHIHTLPGHYQFLETRRVPVHGLKLCKQVKDQILWKQVEDTAEGLL